MLFLALSWKLHNSAYPLVRPNLKWLEPKELAQMSLLMRVGGCMHNFDLRTSLAFEPDAHSGRPDCWRVDTPVGPHGGHLLLGTHGAMQAGGQAGGQGNSLLF